MTFIPALVAHVAKHAARAIAAARRRKIEEPARIAFLRASRARVRCRAWRRRRARRRHRARLSWTQRADSRLVIASAANGARRVLRGQHVVSDEVRVLLRPGQVLLRRRLLAEERVVAEPPQRVARMAFLR